MTNRATWIDETPNSILLMMGLSTFLVTIASITFLATSALEFIEARQVPEPPFLLETMSIDTTQFAIAVLVNRPSALAMNRPNFA